MAQGAAEEAGAYRSAHMTGTAGPASGVPPAAAPSEPVPTAPVGSPPGAEASPAAEPLPPVPSATAAAPPAALTLPPVPGLAAGPVPVGTPPTGAPTGAPPVGTPPQAATVPAPHSAAPGAAAVPPPPQGSEESADAESPQPPGPLYVVGDVHGYLDELRAALRAAGLTDAEDGWAGGQSRLWFLGDFTDRGPDGVGVIDLVMRLSAEAAAAGGYCKALLGNHELLLLGAHRFGDTPVESGAGTATFRAAWMLNGGQAGDMERLRDHHVQWMARLDAMALADGHLLVHSDATAYHEYGATIEDVNDAITLALQRQDVDETWDLFRKFTKRFAFRDDGGVQTARELLETYGGDRVVHGHSPIPYLTGEGAGDADGDEDGGGPPVSGPYLYAEDLALAMDGGVTMGGPMLIARLPID